MNEDTVFCFTISQSKAIAKKITATAYCDSVAIEQQEIIALLHSAKNNKDSTIANLEEKIINLNSIKYNNKVSMQHYEKTMELHEKLLKRSKFHKVLLSVGLGIITVVAISK